MLLASAQRFCEIFRKQEFRAITQQKMDKSERTTIETIRASFKDVQKGSIMYSGLQFLN